MPVTTIDNYVGGEMVGPAGDRWLDVFNPATGDVHARVPDSDADDVEAAVRARRRAHPTWAATAMDERAAVLQRIADLIERDHELLALAECNDNGKPLSLARSVDIPRAAKNLRFFAAAAVSFASESHQLPDAINYTLRQPIGVVACISPWNLPLYLFTWKIAPALAAGNSAVGKPSEITPLTAFLLGERCKEAGLPPGVLNVVHGAATAPATRWSRTRESKPFRSPVEQRPARRSHASQPRCSRNCRWNSAARTRRSFSPMPIWRRRFPLP